MAQRGLSPLLSALLGAALGLVAIIAGRTYASVLVSGDTSFALWIVQLLATALASAGVGYMLARLVIPLNPDRSYLKPIAYPLAVLGAFLSISSDYSLKGAILAPLLVVYGFRRGDPGAADTWNLPPPGSALLSPIAEWLPHDRPLLVPYVSLATGLSGAALAPAFWTLGHQLRAGAWGGYPTGSLAMVCLVLESAAIITTLVVPPLAISTGLVGQAAMWNRTELPAGTSRKGRWFSQAGITSGVVVLAYIPIGLADVLTGFGRYAGEGL